MATLWEEITDFSGDYSPSVTVFPSGFTAAADLTGAEDADIILPTGLAIYEAPPAAPDAALSVAQDADTTFPTELGIYGAPPAAPEAVPVAPAPNPATVYGIEDALITVPDADTVGPESEAILNRCMLLDICKDLDPLYQLLTQSDVLSAPPTSTFIVNAYHAIGYPHKELPVLTRLNMDRHNAGTMLAIIRNKDAAAKWEFAENAIVLINQGILAKQRMLHGVSELEFKQLEFYYNCVAQSDLSFSDALLLHCVSLLEDNGYNCETIEPRVEVDAELVLAISKKLYCIDSVYKPAPSNKMFTSVSNGDTPKAARKRKQGQKTKKAIQSTGALDITNSGSVSVDTQHIGSRII